MGRRTQSGALVLQRRRGGAPPHACACWDLWQHPGPALLVSAEDSLKPHTAPHLHCPGERSASASGGLGIIGIHRALNGDGHGWRSGADPDLIYPTPGPHPAAPAWLMAPGPGHARPPACPGPWLRRNHQLGRSNRGQIIPAAAARQDADIRTGPRAGLEHTGP